MQKILHHLLQPFPFEQRWSAILKTAFGVSLFVVFFLYCFQPFGTAVPAGAEGRYLIICGYFGLVTFATNLIVNGICALLPQVFDERKWTVWKEILFNLFFISCIGFGNLLLANFLWNVPFSGRNIWIWQGITFAVGIFPAVLGALLGYMKWNSLYAGEAARIHFPAVHPQHSSLIELAGENQHELISLDAAQLAYIAAQDNYVQVFYFEQGVLRNKMLRSTLRKMEDALAYWPQFFRCHRTFMVNFDLVERVSGNAQGYRLHLAGVDESIPVSRNLNDEIRRRAGLMR